MAARASPAVRLFPVSFSRTFSLLLLRLCLTAAAIVTLRAAAADRPTGGAGLDLGARVQPVPLEARFSDPGWHIWCGAPIQGDDGKFHLLYSRWPLAVGLSLIHI